MKIRGSGGKGQKIEAQMAPMIDVVFQLLIFFMLTLKIIEPEGDFNVNMPIGQPTTSVSQDIQVPIRVRLIADASGNLAQLQLGNDNLATGIVESTFENLNRRIGSLVATNPLREEMEVEIDADYNLNYEFVIRTIGACRGRAQPNSAGQVDIIPYVEKIKFAAPRPAPGS